MDALNNLLPQLLETVSPLTVEDLEEIIQSESSHLLMVELNGSYVGSLTLTAVKIPTGIKAWIEDVVVSEKTRGRGVGRHLVKHAVGMAGNLGAQTVSLTSGPSRVAANKLYKKLGFGPIETNVYRYKSS
ncbi:GNAT family N-acetyltransferase [Desulfosarcina alkanivorans]|uniref:GNAT family N-acetyltransferase n=1 Tax=Desulfosarcina alkanivorans TaxID=571177 RepID=UPI0018D631F1|nr:GNAT family N-acetyltransferase [Desulfosarcina alkanivorans]